MSTSEKVERDISSLRSTINWLVSEGDIIVSDKEVDPDAQITGLQKKLDGSLGLLFRKVKGYPLAGKMKPIAREN